MVQPNETFDEGGSSSMALRVVSFGGAQSERGQPVLRGCLDFTRLRMRRSEGITDGTQGRARFPLVINRLGSDLLQESHENVADFQGRPCPNIRFSSFMRASERLDDPNHDSYGLIAHATPPHEAIRRSPTQTGLV